RGRRCGGRRCWTGKERQAKDGKAGLGQAEEKIRQLHGMSPGDRGCRQNRGRFARILQQVVRARAQSGGTAKNAENAKKRVTEGRKKLAKTGLCAPDHYVENRRAGWPGGAASLRDDRARAGVLHWRKAFRL